MPARFRADKREILRLAEVRLERLVEADQPLVLIGHKGRSGGTLVNQLLDGHPQLHVHPYELEFGRRDANPWPVLDLGGDPEAWFEQLVERHVRRSYFDGYVKDAGRKGAGDGRARERFPFLLVPSLQEYLFLELVRHQPPRSQREIFDHYFSSYFNAWLDNQNLYGPVPKRWVVGHRARLARSRESRERFLATYADGRLVAPVRDPKGWYASARRLRGEREGLDAAMANWLDAATETLHAQQRFPDRVLVVAFERLVAETDGVMDEIVAWLGVDADPAPCRPTFNGMPIKANSSRPVDGPGVRREPLTAWHEELTDRECARIDELGGDAHRALTALTVAPA